MAVLPSLQTCCPCMPPPCLHACLHAGRVWPGVLAHPPHHPWGSEARQCAAEERCKQPLRLCGKGGACCTRFCRCLSVFNGFAMALNLCLSSAWKTRWWVSAQCCEGGAETIGDRCCWEASMRAIHSQPMRKTNQATVETHDYY